MQRLEADKEQLRMQVSVLAEQVDAQADKMADLERMLDDKKRELNKAEETLQLVSHRSSQHLSVTRIALLCIMTF